MICIEANLNHPCAAQVAAEALLAFATRDDDERLWLQDVAAHGGCDDLLEILKKDVAHEAGRDAAYDLLVMLSEVDGRRHALIDAIKKRRGAVFWEKHERNLNDERALKSALRALKVEAEVAFERIQKRRDDRASRVRANPEAAARLAAAAETAEQELLELCDAEAKEREPKASKKKKKKKKKAQRRTSSERKTLLK